MAAALQPWPHAAAATETRVHFHGEGTMHVHDKPHHHPCSVRLHGDLILSHGPRRVDAKGLDHRLDIADPAVLESDDACSDLIYGMLADAPATAGYDLAEDNWTYSAPVLTPVDIAMAIVRRFRGEMEKRGVATGLEFDIELPELWVTLLYSEPKALLLACKEAAAKTEATGRKRRRESDEPCAICLAEADTRDEEETVTLPCSHAYHSGCILTWFHREWTCPTCRCDIMECFSFVRSPSAEQLTDDVGEDEPEVDEPWLYLGDRYVPFFYPDDVDEASNSEDEFVDTINFSDPELIEGEEFADSQAQSEQLM
ncbi:hypothetical protein ZWY2020_027182 [Hordeum vulgare]|nr:hypothetical protein ZWY2020_027182 [Hordeum vulgare]